MAGRGFGVNLDIAVPKRLSPSSGVWGEKFAWRRLQGGESAEKVKRARREGARGRGGGKKEIERAVKGA